uniref:Interleukin 1 receptor type 1 n=1 Tax=Pelusios castaneus TaxID=367368 RepID=A0A8C8SIW7_9SAUR
MNVERVVNFVTIVKNQAQNFLSHFLSSFLVFHFLEECKVYDVNDVLLNQNFVHEGQPLAVNCSLDKILKLENTDYNLTWYKTGSQTSVSRDKHSRIYQQKNFIWFLPATLEDSGTYECVVRCRKIYMKLTVFKNMYGLCFNEKFAIGQEILTSSNAKVVCPHLDYFRDEKNTLPIRWYKECKLLEEERFFSFNDYLVIINATLHDKGNYTCSTSYTYNGKQYNISRDISLTVSGIYLLFLFMSLHFKILYRFSAVCARVCVRERWWCTFHFCILVILLSFSYDGRPLTTVRLNISEVNSMDYEHHFVCHALNSFGQVAAYIALKHRVIDFQRSLTGGLAALLLLTVVALLIFKLFKIDIVLWYRSSCRPFVKKNASDGKSYDAFVTYPKANGVSCLYTLDNFVLRIFPEVLERQCGYNLFILGRDELLGEAVVNIMDETIKQSRRLIIILGSSSYSVLEDSFEQQFALYNALIRDEIKVILIELDEIQDYTNMSESINYIKQKHGAIRWKGDFTEKSHSANAKFWKKVRYQMPSRQNVSSSDLRLLSLLGNV